MILRRVTAPSAALITLADARAHCRITQTSLDAQVQLAIDTAHAQCESATGRALGSQRWAVVMDDFPRCGDLGIRLAAPPLVTVVSVAYTDTNGVPQTIDPGTLQLDADSEPGVLFPPYGSSWPSVRCMPNAVRVLVDCGYTAGTLPAPLRRWMLGLISHWVDNPGATAEQTQNVLLYLDNLLDGYRVIRMDT